MLAPSSYNLPRLGGAREKGSDRKGDGPGLLPCESTCTLRPRLTSHGGRHSRSWGGARVVSLLLSRYVWVDKVKYLVPSLSIYGILGIL